MKSKFIVTSLLLGAMKAAEVSAATPQWQMKEAPMMTPWATQIDTSCPLPEYPRPQMVRDEGWLNLNGIWELRKGVTDEPFKSTFDYDKSILVPYPIESALSGVMEKSDDQCYWYRRTFAIPEDMKGKRLLLHFGAVDWEAKAYVNGKEVGRHTGGYDPFTFDITEAVDPAKAEQEIVVYIDDNTGVQGQMTGKQSKNPSICWYTCSSGIWQTVWLEAAPESYITGLEMEPTLSQNWISLKVAANDAAAKVNVSVKDREGKEVAATNGSAPDAIIRVTIPDAHPWSPEDPYLYDVDITLTKDGKEVDKVSSYCGMRRIEVKNVDGTPRIFLNGEQIFQIGTLDQGFWPDGLHTPPSEEAMIFDIKTMKDLGFNMVRKHIKVEPDRWYYLCDREGILVWQDLPSGNVVQGYEEVAKSNYKDEAVRIIAALKNHPSIVHWVVFNEGWGQFDTPEVTALVQNNVNRLSPARFGKASLICNASGWTDHEIGDIIDTHSYPHPSCPTHASRAAVCGEYGGITLKEPGHIWPGGDFQYTVVETKGDFTDYFNMLCDELMDLYHMGLNAAVYTQIADVEIEKNGILTYDRKVLKTDNPAKLRSKIEEVIALPHSDMHVTPIISTSGSHRYKWRYNTSSNVPAHWQETGFDDSSWPVGEAAFGANVGSSQNLVGTNWNTNRIVMRRWFKIGDLTPEEIETLRFVTFHDDDIEIYINGVWAASRTGFTGGYIPVDISDAAKAAIRPGEWNLIAILGKQGSGGQIMDLGISAFSDKDIEYTEDFSEYYPTEFTEYEDNVVNPATPSFKKVTATDFSHTADRSNVAWGDIDNDGNLELLYSGHHNHLNADRTLIYKHAGEGAFKTVNNSIAPCFYADPVWLDIDNDGNLDLFMPGLKNRNYSDNLADIAAFLYKNDGKGNFTDVNVDGAYGIAPIYNARDGGRSRHWASAGDYNNDGFTDIVVMGYADYEDTDTDGTPLIRNDRRVLSLYKNLGGNGFELQRTPLDGVAELPGFSRGSVYFADLDNDGNLDIMASGYGSLEANLHIYWNNGDGTFSELPGRMFGSYDSSCVPADFNADGLTDILVTGYSNYGAGSRKDIYIYRNDGNRKFSLVINDKSGFEGVDGATPDVADVNGDGYPDILIGGHGSTHEITTWLYLNRGDFTFKDMGGWYDDPFGKKFTFDRISHGNCHLIDYDNDNRLDAWTMGWASSSGCGKDCNAQLYTNTSADVNAAPSAPENLRVAYDAASGKLILSWDAATDDNTPAEALRYNVFVRKAGDDKAYMTLPADIATGRMKVTELAPAIAGTTISLSIPVDNAEYEWGVQAIDNGKAAGKFATAKFNGADLSSVDGIAIDTTPAVYPLEHALGYTAGAGAATLSIYNAAGILVRRDEVTGRGTVALPQPGLYVASLAAKHHSPATIKFIIH
ncbi:MAG: glycoside hydrolase family 2 [Bacteroidales bacterium]|nr:glycoside hydrolase family 2 [Bacteroidales bacterium]